MTRFNRKECWVKLGSEHPELRPSIRPLLASLDKETGLSMYQSANVFLQLQKEFGILYTAASQLGKMMDTYGKDLPAEDYLIFTGAVESLDPSMWLIAFRAARNSSIQIRSFVLRPCTDGLESVQKIYALMAPLK